MVYVCTTCSSWLSYIAGRAVVPPCLSVLLGMCIAGIVPPLCTGTGFVWSQNSQISLVWKPVNNQRCLLSRPPPTFPILAHSLVVNYILVKFLASVAMVMLRILWLSGSMCLWLHLGFVCLLHNVYILVIVCEWVDVLIVISLWDKIGFYVCMFVWVPVRCGGFNYLSKMSCDIPNSRMDVCFSVPNWNGHKNRSLLFFLFLPLDLCVGSECTSSLRKSLSSCWCSVSVCNWRSLLFCRCIMYFCQVVRPAGPPRPCIPYSQ